MLIWGWGLPSGFAQILHPDSLMLKAENLGQELLYRNHDSTYITSYAEYLNIKLLATTKINFFKITDKDNASSVRQ
jgi:hypothetical protein